jgi:hypothetical protein
LSIEITGDIPAIAENDEDLYEGNLVFYLNHVFHSARNRNLPYHNFRHMCHVMRLCYSACQYYAERLTKRDMRNLLIAALFHDFNHSGRRGQDNLNIGSAVSGLFRCIRMEDLIHYDAISQLIRATEYPHTIPASELPLEGLIIRDADLAQVLDRAWIQQVVIGLAEEWDNSPYEALLLQPGFLSKLNFHTDWARRMFPPESVQEKISEAERLIKILRP